MQILVTAFSRTDNWKQFICVLVLTEQNAAVTKTLLSPIKNIHQGKVPPCWSENSIEIAYTTGEFPEFTEIFREEMS